MNSQKTRTPVPKETADEVLVASDRTCCVCRTRGKRVQTHHIDENPSNHDTENLAVLCFDCHDLTMIRGGFGRRLSAGQVAEYRDDWLVRVRARRDRADELAAEAMASGTGSSDARTEEDDSGFDAPDLTGGSATRPELLRFLSALPRLKRKLRTEAQSMWDTGITAEMMQGSYGLIDGLEGILVTLAKWYPPNHFDGDPREFMSRVTASRFEWHRNHLEPDGHGSGGTMMGPIISSEVISDLEEMIEEMVRSLMLGIGGDSPEFSAWQLAWEG